MRVALIALAVFIHSVPADAQRSRRSQPIRAKSVKVPQVRQASSVYYKNCAAARAAGAAPVYRGEPGYARHLDRDNDGVGCE